MTEVVAMPESRIKHVGIYGESSCRLASVMTGLSVRHGSINSEVAECSEDAEIEKDCGGRVL